MSKGGENNPDEIKELKERYEVLRKIILQVVGENSLPSDNYQDKETLVKIIVPFIGEHGYTYENGFLFD